MLEDTMALTGIKIRIVEEEDRAACSEILAQHHANTTFRDQPFSEDKFNLHFDRVLARPRHMMGIVAEWNETVIGLCWMMSDTYMLSDGPPFVTVQVIAVNLYGISARRRAKCFLSLIAGVKAWTLATGSSHAMVHVTTGFELESTERLMLAAGAEVIGNGYELGLIK